MSTLSQNDPLNKAGKTEAGSQRYRGMQCQRKYTPEPKLHGYPEKLRKQASAMYVDGKNLRKIARHLKVHHLWYHFISAWILDDQRGRLTDRSNRICLLET